MRLVDATSTLTAVGFEPTHPEIVVLETTALVHSAILSLFFFSSHWGSNPDYRIT